MLVVETIARIRREHLDRGKSIRRIARELKLSRNTVRKAIRGDVAAFSYERLRLADPGRTQEHDVLGALEEPEFVLSICSRLMLGWNAKSNCDSVLTAGRREARMAVCSRR